MLAELVHLSPCSDDLFVGIDNVLVNVSGDGFIGERNGSVGGIGGISTLAVSAALLVLVGLLLLLELRGVRAQED